METKLQILQIATSHTVEQLLFARKQFLKGLRKPRRCDKFSQQTIPQIY